MMQSSNNVYTRALRFAGGSARCAMAASLGLSSTHLRQPYIGCGFDGVPGGVRNELTLADAARLYAAVDNGTALSGTPRLAFFDILAGHQAASDPWGRSSRRKRRAWQVGDRPAVPAQLNVR